MKNIRIIQLLKNMGIHLVLVCFCFFVFYLTFNYDIELSILEKPRKNITTEILRQQNHSQQPKPAKNIKNTSQNSSEKGSSLDQGLYDY